MTAPARNARPERLETAGLAKVYGNVTALRSVTMSVGRGEILVLLGENGAGKSTLLKLLAGFERPTGGGIRYQGSPVNWKSLAQARAAGIGLLPQHLSIIPALTVEENVWLALPKGASRSEARRAVAEFAPQLEAGMPAAELSLGERQALEFTRMLAVNCEVLLLDEPTAVLSPFETDTLFERLRGLKAQNKSIILVTHKLADVDVLADRVLVMRQGSAVLECEPPFAADELIRAAVGEGIGATELRPHVSTGEVAITWNGRLRKGGRESALTLHRGEVIAVCGVDGNGQQELMDQLLDAGSSLPGNRPAFIPQDRIREGLVGGWSLAENLLLGHENAVSPARWWSRRQMDRQAGNLLEKFDVQPPDPATRAQHLSGGNQQKVIMARELGSDKNPVWILAVNPARGLDFRATQALYARLRAAAEGGAGVLLVTMDLDEALQLGDRFAVLFRGELLWIDERPVRRETFGRLMLGGKL